MPLWLRYLQTEVAKDDATGNVFVDSFKDPWTLFKYIATGVFLILLFSALLREYLFYRWGIDCCRRGRNSPLQEQQAEDRRRAMELQMELAEEMAQEGIHARRQERRRKYEQFLAPYTMVLKGEHFYYAVDKVDGKREVYPLASSNSASVANKHQNGDHHEGMTDETDIEAANHSGNPEPTHDVLIKIPPSPNGEPRYVDGSCSICLLDYEVGDTIIRSTRRVCHHAFHDDCILAWLSKGKKRCPICRNFFVPGSKIDDKKVITHDAGDLQASTAGSNVVADEEEIESEIDRMASIQEGGDLVTESSSSVSNQAS